MLCALLAAAPAGAQLSPPIPDPPFKPAPEYGYRLNDPPMSRVGRSFWLYPKYRPFSPELYDSPRLSRRLGVEGKQRFRIVELLATGPSFDPQYIYRLRFDDGREAYIAVPAFEREYFVDHGDLSVTGLKGEPGSSGEEFLFERRSFFAEDPDLLRERLERRGPRVIRVLPAPR